MHRISRATKPLYAIKIKMFKSGEDNLSHSIDTNQRKLQKRTLKIFRTYPNQFDAKVWMQLLVGGVLKWTRQLHANRRSNSVSGLSERVRRRVMMQRSVCRSTPCVLYTSSIMIDCCRVRSARQLRLTTFSSERPALIRYGAAFSSVFFSIFTASVTDTLCAISLGKDR